MISVDFAVKVSLVALQKFVQQINDSSDSLNVNGIDYLHQIAVQAYYMYGLFI